MALPMTEGWHPAPLSQGALEAWPGGQRMTAVTGVQRQHEDLWSWPSVGCRPSPVSTAAGAAIRSRPGHRTWMRLCLAALQAPGPHRQTLTHPGWRRPTEPKEWAERLHGLRGPMAALRPPPPGAVPPPSHQGRRTNTGNSMGRCTLALSIAI